MTLKIKNILRAHYQFFLSVIEVIILTGIYYYFWRIGYDHGIPGYPEYFGRGRFVLMFIYIAMLWLLNHFAGGFRFKRVRTVNLVLNQWFVLLAVNLITFLQLSLTAVSMVARRPMFDATIAEAVFCLIFILLTNLLVRRIRGTEKMLAIGEGIPENTVIDGYRVSLVYSEPLDGPSYSAVFPVIDQFDAVIVSDREKYLTGLLQYCEGRKAQTYVASDHDLIYGVNRGYDDNGRQYVLVHGVGEKGERFFDRLRAYLT